MLFTAAVLAFGLHLTQTSPATDAPSPVITETWELSYDIAISPYIEDYRRCLNYGNRIARGVADFEQQHRTDLPRYLKIYEESVAASNKAVKRRNRSSVSSPAAVKHAFDLVGKIHIERGRFIDDTFRQRLSVLERYRAENAPPAAPRDRPKGEDTNRNAQD